MRGQNPNKVSCLLYNKMHRSPSLSSRSTKQMFQCTDAAGGHVFPTAYCYSILIFCIHLLHCIFTSAVSFLGEPRHRSPCLSWGTSHEVLTETPLRHPHLQGRKAGEVVEIVRSSLPTVGSFFACDKGFMVATATSCCCSWDLPGVSAFSLLLLLCVKSGRILPAWNLLSQVAS